MIRQPLCVPRLVRWAIAAVLIGFAAYGVFSTPGLVRGWQLPPVAVLALVGWVAVAAVPFLLEARVPHRALVAGGIVVTLALRFVIGSLVGGRIPPGDSLLYLDIARHLIDGRGFFVFDPFMGVLTRGLFPPLYPTLLAGWGLIAGLSTTSLVALNMIVDLATAAMIVRLAQAIGNRRAGYAVAWLFLIWPSVLLSAPVAQKEGLCVLFAVALACLWMDAGRKGTAGWTAFSVGVIAGFLALTQPGEAPLASMFGIALIARLGWRRVMLVGLAAIPFAIAVMVPWWIRNWLMFGVFVPLTTAGGYNFWVGNNPAANGHWMPPPRQLYGMQEVTFGKAAARIAVTWIVGHPIDFVHVTIAKVLRAWGISEFGVARFHWMKPHVAMVTTATAFAVSQAAHLAMLVAGAVATRFRRGGASALALLLVAACLAQTLLFGIWFEFGERHRDFATPFLLLSVATIFLPARKRARYGDRTAAARVV